MTHAQPTQIDDAQQAVSNVDLGWAQSVKMVGTERWQMPVARFHAPRGFCSTFDGDMIGNNTISLTQGGAKVTCTEGPARGRWTNSSSAITVLPRGSKGGFEATAPLTYVHFYFSQQTKESWIEDCREHGLIRDMTRDNFVFVSDAELGRAFSAYLARAFDPAEPPTRLEMDSRAGLIGSRLIRRHGDDARGAYRKPSNGLSPWQVRRACDAMVARIDGDASLAEIASSVGLSETHFSRAFKQATGTAPFGWLMRERIERAKMMLEADRSSLCEIALAVGFSAQPAFTTAFRRAVGVTPGVWRRERRQ